MQRIQEKQSRAKAGAWSQGVAEVLAGVEKKATYFTIRETATGGEEAPYLKERVVDTSDVTDTDTGLW